jgi:hypothetical protein
MHDVTQASRPYPDKELDVIVESNGMSKGLRRSLAQSTLGDKDQGTGVMDFVILDDL